jgi:hypothetical protein
MSCLSTMPLSHSFPLGPSRAGAYSVWSDNSLKFNQCHAVLQHPHYVAQCWVSGKSSGMFPMHFCSVGGSSSAWQKYCSMMRLYAGHRCWHTNTFQGAIMTWFVPPHLHTSRSLPLHFLGPATGSQRVRTSASLAEDWVQWRPQSIWSTECLSA